MTDEASLGEWPPPTPGSGPATQASPHPPQGHPPTTQQNHTGNTFSGYSPGPAPSATPTTPGTPAAHPPPSYAAHAQHLALSKAATSAAASIGRFDPNANAAKPFSAFVGELGAVLGAYTGIPIPQLAADDAVQHLAANPLADTVVGLALLYCFNSHNLTSGSGAVNLERLRSLVGYNLDAERRALATKMRADAAARPPPTVSRPDLAKWTAAMTANWNVWSQQGGTDDMFVLFIAQHLGSTDAWSQHDRQVTLDNLYHWPLIVQRMFAEQDAVALTQATPRPAYAAASTVHAPRIRRGRRTHLMTRSGHCHFCNTDDPSSECCTFEHECTQCGKAGHVSAACLSSRGARSRNNNHVRDQCLESPAPIIDTACGSTITSDEVAFDPSTRTGNRITLQGISGTLTSANDGILRFRARTTTPGEWHEFALPAHLVHGKTPTLLAAVDLARLGYRLDLPYKHPVLHTPDDSPSIPLVWAESGVLAFAEAAALPPPTGATPVMHAARAASKHRATHANSGSKRTAPKARRRRRQRRSAAKPSVPRDNPPDTALGATPSRPAETPTLKPNAAPAEAPAPEINAAPAEAPVHERDVAPAQAPAREHDAAPAPAAAHSVATTRDSATTPPAPLRSCLAPTSRFASPNPFAPLEIDHGVDHAATDQVGGAEQPPSTTAPLPPPPLGHASIEPVASEHDGGAEHASPADASPPHAPSTPRPADIDTDAASLDGGADQVQQPDGQQRPAAAAPAYAALTFEDAHARFGHLGADRIQAIRKAHPALGIRAPRPDASPCPPCAEGKLTRAAHGKGPHPPRSTAPGQVFHLDSTGIKHPSNDGARYALVFTDDFSHYRRGYCIATKNSASVIRALRNWQADVLGPGRHPGCILHVDRDSAFVSKSTAHVILDDMGWVIKEAVPAEHQSHGIAERAIDIAARGTSSIIHDLPGAAGRGWWPLALEHYLLNYNHAPHPQTGMSPAKTLGHYDMLPHIRRFGALVLVRNATATKSDWASKTRPGINLGLSLDHQVGTYRVFMLGSKRVVFARSLTFFERVLPHPDTSPELAIAAAADVG